MTAHGRVLLGTVALEPNRWATIDASGAPSIALAEWLDAIAATGFDGIELWERHLTAASDADVDRLLDGTVPITVFNSYASFDEPDPTDRGLAAKWATRTGCHGVKFNVGNDPAARDTYAERIAGWLTGMPDHVALLCECHEGISIAEDPAVAAAIFDAAGPPDRVQAIVHTHEGPEGLRARFDAYGERITHVHVNHLSSGGAPPLADVRDQLERTVATLTTLGFDGSWTIEFVNGLLTDRDHPAELLAQAKRDLVVLRDVLAGARQ